MIPKSRRGKLALAAAAAGLLLAAAVGWHALQGMQFRSEVQAAAQAGVGAVLLCGAQDARACRALTRDTALLHLSQATPLYLPGRPAGQGEWILRLTRRSGGGHVACYRVVDPGAGAELRLYRVAMDPSCERVERHLAGALAVSRHAFGATAP